MSDFEQQCEEPKYRKDKKKHKHTVRQQKGTEMPEIKQKKRGGGIYRNEEMTERIQT